MTDNILGDLSSIARAKLEAEAANLGDEFKAFLSSHYGVTPEVVSDVKDAGETASEDLVSIVKSLRAELDALKAQKAAPVNAVQDAVTQGGEPVAHDLHLSDGRVINAHPGLATHYDDGNKITRVIGAFPTENQ